MNMKIVLMNVKNGTVQQTVKPQNLTLQFSFNIIYLIFLWDDKYISPEYNYNILKLTFTLYCMLKLKVIQNNVKYWY